MLAVVRIAKRPLPPSMTRKTAQSAVARSEAHPGMQRSHLAQRAGHTKNRKRIQRRLKKKEMIRAGRNRLELLYAKANGNDDV